jgi:hypothetical protein
VKVPVEVCHNALRSTDQCEAHVYTSVALFILKFATLPGIGCLGYGM